MGSLWSQCQYNSQFKELISSLLPDSHETSTWICAYLTSSILLLVCFSNAYRSGPIIARRETQCYILRLELILGCQYEANMVSQPRVKDWMCACVLQLQKRADLLVIAPLSANTMAKMANGICDNLLVCNLLQYSIMCWSVFQVLRLGYWAARVLSWNLMADWMSTQLFSQSYNCSIIWWYSTLMKAKTIIEVQLPLFSLGN